MIQYGRACLTFDTILNLSQYTVKEVEITGVSTANLQAAFHKSYRRYNDVICPNNLDLGLMLSDVFHINL
jgi:hypothetical protein